MIISFIIPIYNAYSTLTACFRSILSQGLDPKDYEVILVNDGSTDRSYDLCQDLKKEYPSTRVFSQDNKGQSEARNIGISAADGDYLCFVDADDVLVSDGLSSLIPYCKENYDLIRFWSELKHSGTGPNKTPSDGHIVFQGDGYNYLRRFGLETFCWCYLYRRSFLIQKNLRFQPGIIGEDFAFMYDVMMARPIIISLASRIYQYNIVSDSLSTRRSPEHSRRWVGDLKETIKRICYGLDSFREKDYDLYEKCRQSLDEKTISLFSRALSAKYLLSEYKSFLDECKKIGLIPLSSEKLRGRKTMACNVIALLIRFPALYPIASFLFCRVFLPFIYPRLDRNG